MCRFTCYLGEPIVLEALLTQPRNSLLHQSLHSPLPDGRPVHADGFGVSWYAPELSDRPAVFRDVSPAWNNQNLFHLARVTKSSCVLAHVRAASVGLPVSLVHCHPFTYRRLSFAHNGFLARYLELRPALLRALADPWISRLEGSTDSELLFAFFLQEYEALEDLEGGERLRQSLTQCLAKIEGILKEQGVDEVTHLNLVVTDGAHVAASRLSWPEGTTPLSLYVCRGRRYAAEDGDCGLSEDAEGPTATLVSSEPLCSAAPWRALPPQSILIADTSERLEIQPYSSPEAGAPKP